jgi:hypothetical protein
MADQGKGRPGKGGNDESRLPKGYRAQRDAEGGEESGFERALQPDLLSEGVTCLVGLVGQSTREGYRVLFLGLDMNSRVEIRDEDIVYSEKLTPEESPFGSLGGTRICVRKGATLDYTRTTARQVQAEAVAGDEFDLDIRLGGRSSLRSNRLATVLPPETLLDTRCNCTDNTCDTCDTCFRTRCATCVTCLQTRCETCVTCVTCQPTGCGQTCDTCVTCQPTGCRQTCNTCDTCDTCFRTRCETCPGNTCLTCDNTCAGTCDTCHPGCFTRANIACGHTQGTCACTDGLRCRTVAC